MSRLLPIRRPFFPSKQDRSKRSEPDSKLLHRCDRKVFGAPGIIVETFFNFFFRIIHPYKPCRIDDSPRFVRFNRRLYGGAVANITFFSA